MNVLRRGRSTLSKLGCVCSQSRFKSSKETAVSGKENTNSAVSSQEKTTIVDPCKDNPIFRTANIIASDLGEIKEKVLGKKPLSYRKEIFPHHCDILIIGGGVMGFSIAYWLQQRALDHLRIVVVEQDPTYQKSTSVLSVGGLRQQFSLKENIELSMASAEFMRNIKHHLGVEGADPPDICFNPCGYLFLASERGTHILQDNYNLQTSLGAKVELLSPEKLKEKFPFMNTDGVALGCHGLENEGWFDPWSLLSAFKRKAVALGTEVVNGKVTSFDFMNKSPIYNQYFAPGEYTHVEKANVKLEDGSVKSIKFSQLIVAAGCNTGEVGKLIGMGSGAGPLGAPIPIEPRKRYVFVMHCPDAPGLAMPFIIDPTGAYVRREGVGGQYLCGISPGDEEQEPCCDNMDVDYEFFENKLWPIIANRVPAFECAKVKTAWSGFYDFNSFDENAFIGPHPAFHNVHVVAGFSGHGIQQSPAVGRAMMEIIFDGEFRTIDLSRLGMERYLNNEPLYESNIV
uniref:FAD-dependent oxidoreductase domain-containing protein 1 n=1 Tax=Lygus hesperus TaxID=30085 RepID=A0A146LL39_LYGHE